MNRNRAACVILVVFALFAGPLPFAEAQVPRQERERRRSSEVPGLVSESQVRAEDAPVGDFSNDPSLPRPEQPEETSFDLDRSELLEDETTETQLVYANPDGSRTAVIHQGPVRFRDDEGDWQDIDLTPVEAVDGEIRPEAVPQDLVIRTDEEGAVVELETPAGPVVARHLDEVDGAVADGADPVIDDGTVVFEDVLPGDRDVTVVPTATGWEESVVLDSAGGAPGYVTQVSVPEGVTAHDVAGAVELRHPDGAVFGVFGGGYAHDAEVNRSGTGAETEVVSRLVGQDGATVTIEVSIDEAWLRHPARAFPVVIDPTFSAAPGIDTWAQTTFSSSQAASTELRVGTFDGGSTLANTMMRFNINVATNPRYQVTEANLSLTNWHSYSCMPSGVNLARLTASPTTATVWSNQPGVTGDVYRYDFAQGYSGACPAARIDLPVQELAQRWFAGTSPNHGVKLWATNERDSNSWKKFDSMERGASGPRLQVTYTTLPTQATPNSPADKAVLTDPVPTLRVNAGSDADGDPLRYRFKVGTSPDAEGGAVADSGWISGTSWQIPAGVLNDGVTYYWKTYTWDTKSWPEEVSWTPRSFKLDMRLGAQGPSAYDSAGPVSVNLYNGNVIAEASSPSFETVGGSIGFSFTYNSRQQPNTGLLASYYDESFSPNRIFDDQVFLERRDPMVNFGWGTGAPTPGMNPDNFLVRWRGFVTVPTTGSYHFGASSDDGVRIWVNGTQVLNRWSSGARSTPGYGTAVNLTAGTPVSIRVEYFEATGGAHMQLFAKGPVSEQVVPASWLSTDAPALPDGWSLSADLEGTIGYTSARVTDTAVTITDSTGATHAYTWTGSGYKPPAGDESVLSKNADGSLVLQAEDGMTYTFDQGGKLVSAIGALDDLKPAAAQYVYAGDPARLSRVKDPVSGREHALHYKGSSSCPAAPAGFDAAPPGQMLCGIRYWDGTWTHVFYRGGRLARIVDPGEEITDFAWTAAGKLWKVRDSWLWT